jgi:hypothetical protein
MAGMGVSRLELCSPLGYGADFATLADAKQVRTIMADQGVKCESAHFTLRELRQKQPESIAWAKEIGIEQMIVATLADGNGGSSPTMDQVKKAAEEYNGIAEVAARNGMQQGLHNEGFELSMVDGKRVFDILFDLLDPKLVKFQFQMSTITNGLIAADYFMQHPRALHLDSLAGHRHEHGGHASSCARPGYTGWPCGPPPSEADRSGLHRLG